MGLRALKILFCLLFLCLLIMPALQESFGLFRYETLNENRFKNQKPSGGFQNLFLQDQYARKYEDYFNDHFGFRDLLIKIKNHIDYSLFDKSERVLIGPGGWLFYRFDEEKRITDQMAEAKYEAFFERILRLNEYLKERGITLVMIPIPLKQTLYPEYFPSAATRRPGITIYQRYADFLNAHPEIASIDTRRLFSDLKKDYPVYWKTDTHWNHIGNYYISREIVNLLGRLSGQGVMWKEYFTTEGRQFKGQLVDQLGLLFDLKEDDYLVPSVKLCGTKTRIANDPELAGYSWFLSREFSGSSLARLGRDIRADVPNVRFTEREDSIEWLNEVLKVTDLSAILIGKRGGSGLPADLKKAIDESKPYHQGQFSDLAEPQRVHLLRTNRLLLEYFYKGTCPKMYDNPFSWVYQSNSACGENLLPRTVIYGDSFLDMTLSTAMPNYFSELYTINFTRSHRIRDVIELLPQGTKYLVLGRYEFFLSELMSDEMWPDTLKATRVRENLK